MALCIAFTTTKCSSLTLLPQKQRVSAEGVFNPADYAAQWLS